MIKKEMKIEVKFKKLVFFMQNMLNGNERKKYIN